MMESPTAVTGPVGTGAVVVVVVGATVVAVVAGTPPADRTVEVVAGVSAPDAVRLAAAVAVGVDRLATPRPTRAPRTARTTAPITRSERLVDSMASILADQGACEGASRGARTRLSAHTTRAAAL